MRKFLFAGLFLFPFTINSQCVADNPGIIWQSNDSFVSFYDLASHAAPMLWFSPDEKLLYDEEGHIQLPEAFPFEKSDGPIIYYKIRSLYADGKKPYAVNSSEKDTNFKILDLNDVAAIDLDFYYYFEKETGLGSHLHDIESMALQLSILRTPKCPDYKYSIVVDKVIARAHGLHWYNSVFEVDDQTFFPLSILVEEGKHASATDKNADGVFTPGFDVTKRVNDAWGVRDVITTGRLFSGGYQGWMAKRRDEKSLLFPPYPMSSPHYGDFHKKYSGIIDEHNVYQLRPYPKYPRKDIDNHLKGLMKGKKPHIWPKIDRTKGNGKVKQWIKEERVFRAVGFSYRWDENSALSFSIPLFIFKSVEAPLTGGWLYHKIYLPLDTITTLNGRNYSRLLGHQIVHSSSASRWIDSYIGIGYEIIDTNLENNKIDSRFEFVSEAGIKIRVNISKSPLRFLSFLGDFWGIRLGWKNVGFRHFRQSGFVLEIGAGAF
ncbi:MAG: hypothetical protein V3V00_01465 [Saprospiraceae bacterium]